MKGLIEDLLAVREKVGFTPTTHDTLPIRLMCIDCEVYELEEALLHDTNVAEELADVAMYALTVAHDLSEPLALRQIPVHYPSRYQHPAAFCRPLRTLTKASMEYWRRGNHKDAAMSVELIVYQCQKLAAALRIDLNQAIRLKIDKEASREFRHGGKDPRS